MKPGLMLQFHLAYLEWRLRSLLRPRPPRRSLDLERWERAWRELGLAPPAGLLATVETAWQERQRAYHTIEHLEKGLQLLAEYRHLAANPAELELAFYFHDLVYDPLRHDNEAKSAERATAALLAAGAAPELAGRIAELVMFTLHQAEPPDPDARLLVDVDLAILGAGREDYDRYEQAVREEYGWVPRRVFRAKRAEILGELLARPRIYRTPELHQRFEPAARGNLARAIEALS